ncbi:histidine phosphatase family protein [Thalassotalea piscium]
MAHNIYLLRHGSVTGNAALYGSTDIDVLPEVNQTIMQGIRERQLVFSQVYSSPLQRCKKLAELIAKNCTTTAFDKINVTDDLKEMHFGFFDGVAFDDIYENKSQWQLLEKFWQSPTQYGLPEAESITDFYLRVERQWRDIFHKIDRHSVMNEEANTLIVAHGGVIRMILASILDDDIHQPAWYEGYSIGYGSLTHLSIESNQVSVNWIGKPCSTSCLTKNKSHSLEATDNE